MTSFTSKRLRVTLVLAGANAIFPGTNSNTLVLTNVRMSARVQAVARLSTQADIQIYGMKQDDMNALTVAWANPPIVLNNLVILEANSTGREDGWVQVFKGTVIEAQPNYRAQPDVSFDLSAVTGYFLKINPAEPTSYPFEVDIGVAADDIVTRMGAPWTLVNGGATGVLRNAYFWGTLWDQLSQACAAADTDFYILGDEIRILPAGEGMPGPPVIQLNPETGLEGYPMFERAGLNVVMLFDPAVLCGTPIEIDGGIVPNATGRWFPYSIYHSLDSLVPKGRWHSELRCLRRQT